MPRPVLRFGALVILFGSRMAFTATMPQPPLAKRIEHKEIRHGQTVVDNYYWLRDKKNP